MSNTQTISNLIASRNILSAAYDMRKCRDVDQFRSIGEQIDILDAKIEKLQLCDLIETAQFAD